MNESGIYQIKIRYRHKITEKRLINETFIYDK